MSDEALTRALADDGVIRMAGLVSLLMSASAGVGFGVKGLDGRYRLANREMERLLCRGASRLAGRSESDLLPAHLLARLARCDQRIIDGAPAAYEEIELPVGGSIRQCLWLKLPVLGADQELQSIASIIHEVARSPELPAMQQTLDRLRQANQELQQTVVELEQVAGTDKLTGAWNRRRLEESVRSEMERLNRYEQPLSLLLVDIDHFKAINDQHGHGAGDQALQAVTSLLQSRLRGTDGLARWGGEEFVVVCPNTGRSAAALLAERLRGQIASAEFPLIGQLTVSIGAAECSPGDAWEDWFQRADEALYRAKTGGRNQVQLAPETTPAPDTQEYVVANFVQLVWHSAYECGNELVDRGHRQLFADANELLSAILCEREESRVDTIVDTLTADVLQHFADEEAIILAAGYPGAAEHVVLHRQLVTQARRLLDDYRAGKQGVGDVFQFLAYDVVTRHMLGADRAFFPYLRAHGAKPAGNREAPLA
jgi:diguanylate cyclase (GGDEF)-like protein/hemerythrin-like metal-binding protein